MNPPEHEHPVGDKRTLMERFIKAIKRLFKRKSEEEEIKKAIKVQKEKHHHETSRRRTDERKRQEEKDKERAYHEARNSELEEVEVKITREKRAQEILNELNNLISKPDDRKPGSDYFIECIQRDDSVKKAIIELVRRDSSAAVVVKNLLTQGEEVHGNSRKLIAAAQKLSYVADREGLFNQISPIFEIISKRVNSILVDDFQKRRREAAQRREKIPEDLMEFFEETPEIVTTGEEKRVFHEVKEGTHGRVDWDTTFEIWKDKVKEMVGTRRERKEAEADWVREAEVPESGVAPEEIVAPIDEIMGEVARREASGQKLNPDELQDIKRRINEIESNYYPRDVLPGTVDFQNKVQALHRHTEKNLDTLARKLTQRLREETPRVKEGIIDSEVFLAKINRMKGHLGYLFDDNPEMLRLFRGLDERGRKFRDRVFLKIHSAVLSDQRNSSDANFGLYERADFITFIDLLRSELGKIRVEKTGQTLGGAWADYYNNLSNAIRQSRDLDYWATQPGATYEYFNKSLNMFQNEYIRAATNIPAVNAGFRAYELTLRSIMTAYDGYIPPALIEYDDSTKCSFWDQMSRNILDKMIDMESVPDVKRDSQTAFPQVGDDGHTIEFNRDETGKIKPLEITDWPEAEDQLRMYMTLAKGLGLVSGRYLEMFANARVPGSDHPELGMEGFHSMPYEGLAKALNYFSTYVHKWKMGAYRYYYLFNQLVPDKANWLSEDKNSAARAFMAYQDGTFEEKFGKDAKRFIDLTNFSGISSAIGKDTLWRQFDSTIGWSDKEKELLGGPTQLALSERYAKEKVKYFLTVNKRREEYRQEIIKRNEAQPGLNLPVSGPGFDKLWKEYGEAKYGKEIGREWDKLRGFHPLKGQLHTREAHHTDEMVKKYQKAFKARVWVEMAMRNPLVVAHSLKVDMPYVGVEGKKKVKLHTLLVQDVLGIPPEDVKYLALYSQAGYGTTPSLEQRKYMIAILQLEADLGAVRQRAINEGRDLTEADFREVIKDPKRYEQAFTYWQKVREVILGTSELGAGTDHFIPAERLYKKFGLEFLENGHDYAWDYEEIEKIDDFLKDFKKEGATKVKSQEGKPIEIPFLLKEAVEMEPEWILGTDDMAFGRMDILNLGARHWVRRGGDIISHQMGGDKVVQYLDKGLLPKPDKHELAKMLKEIVDAYSGDMIEIGWTAAGNLAYLTDRLYAFDKNKFGSSAQADVWHTRRNVDAWMANGRREFWDAIEHLSVLPPHAHFYHYNWIEKKQSIHDLRKMCHADNIDVWLQIITLGLLLATLMTVYRALTAKSEEEEGGGGGGGHH